MFVREKKTPLSEKTAVQLVEAIRQKGRVVQRVIRHFGYGINAEEIKALKDIALKYKSELESKVQPSLFETGTLMDVMVQESKEEDKGKPLTIDLQKIVEEKRIKTGIHQVYGNIFNEIGFGNSIDTPSRKKASVRLMRDIVMTRINNPQSKSAAVETLMNEYDTATNVNSVYRMMDLLDEKAITKMQKLCYENTLGLLGGKVDVIFYDCTTLYFESFIEDELKENGYSKDGKFNQGQVILALMVSSQGLPIGYELFPGATFEGHTLSNALKTLHEKYNIDKVIFVADSALLSADNIKLLQQSQQPFIVGARIKNMPAKVTEKILDKTAYKPLYEKSEQKEEVTFQDISLEDKQVEDKQEQQPLRLIVSHSPKRAAKDKHDREKAIEQIKKRLAKSSDPKKLLNNYGYKKYVTIKGEAKVSINQEKIKQAEQWDGLHGIITNIPLTPAKELLSHYKGLWQIEETFRISKHNLRMRPIFHWTPKRIKAHIALCFMALCCVRTVEHKVRVQYKKMSPEEIRKCIAALEVSVLKDTATNSKYILPSKATQDAKKIYQILNLIWREIPYKIN